MFTPPPSPMPLPAPAKESSNPPTISLSTPEEASEYPFPSMTSPSPKSPCTAESVPSRIPLDVKKRTGRRTLLLVTLLPATLIIFASLHLFIRLPVPAVLDDPTSISFVKRDPQLFTATASPMTSGSAPVSLSPTDTPTATSSLPTIPTIGVLPTPFPQAFDASVSDNFTTQGCQAFFSNFTQDENYRQCRSFAFLLNASAAFLQAQRNLTLLNDIIWGTCNTSPTVQTCDSRMSNFLTQLNSICSADITNENPVVLQAQVGFQSYTAMRTAACLPDPSTNAYCYIDAVAASPPEDVFFYALPLGTAVPNNTKPSCSPCVKSVLAVYAQYVSPSPSGSGAIQIGAPSSNSTVTGVQVKALPILSKTYPGAARIAVDQCGGTYASVGVAQPNGAEYHRIVWTMLLAALFAFASWTL